MPTIKNPYWFSPAQSELSSSRLSLDFGLRAADLWFRELVVPQLGRIWFVRQLSWALGALALYEEIRTEGVGVAKPTAIAHGIEALACKLEYHSDNGSASNRILGRRAFGRDRDNEVWSFQRLRQRAYYVQNTHRQSATRSIRSETGLGLSCGSRFDLLELEPVGKALAEAFLEQKIARNLGGTLRGWLTGWIRDEKVIPNDSGTLWGALSPSQPSPSEKALVKSRLLETSSEVCRKRERLAAALGRATKMPDIDTVVIPRLRSGGHGQQAEEVVAARAFGAMLDRTREVMAEITRVVEGGRGGVRLEVVAADNGVSTALERLQAAAENFIAKADTAGVKETSSRAFAKAVGEHDAPALVRFLVPRVEGLLVIADGKVSRGSLFRRIDESDETVDVEEGAASIEPDYTGRTFRIANFHSILQDVVPRERA